MRLRASLIAVQLAAYLLVAGCAANQYPTTAPDPNDPKLTWAERHYIQKMKYQQMTTDRLR
jgi:hypothetical protein